MQPVLDDPMREARQRWLESLSPRDLIKAAPGPNDAPNEMEMQRRLIEAVDRLTGELVMFRDAAGGAAEKSDQAATRLVRLTWVIAVLTAVVIALTGVLIYFAANPPH